MSDTTPRPGRNRPSRPSRFTPQARRQALLFLEALESRHLLATTAAGIDQAITPAVTVIPTVTNTVPSSTAVTPAVLARAYSISPTYTGTGETIAIVDAYNDPNVAADLATFDAQFGLPAANLRVVNQYGGTSLPQTDAGWSLEIAMDVEWAHATAPGASIVLVEANSESGADLFRADQTAAGLSNVVSMSWGGSEFQGEQAYDALFTKPYVSFVAASGDDGGASGAEWPSSSPYVVSVGGTTLSSSGETAWNASFSPWNGYSGSAGGVSSVYAMPTYQTAALGSSYAPGRVTPDVSSVGNPSTGVAVYDSVAGNGSTGWVTVGGTSAGAPVWSGVIASADQARAQTGRQSLGSTDTLNLLYGLSELNGQTRSSYGSVLHDVTTGYNYVGNATTGYDVVTGLGSPIAGNIVAVATAYGPTYAAILAGSAGRAVGRSAVTAPAATTAAAANSVSAAPTVTTQTSTTTADSASSVITIAPAASPSVSLTTSAPATSPSPTAAPAVAPARPSQPLATSATRTTRLTPRGADARAASLPSGWPTAVDFGLDVDLFPSRELPFRNALTDFFLLRHHDRAIASILDEAGSSDDAADARNAPVTEAALLRDESPLGLDPVALTGLAVVAWGAWESQNRRSRRDGKTQPNGTTSLTPRVRHA